VQYTSRTPLVMGILNVTPDSFSDGGRYTDQDDALRHAMEMVNDGADIIDIGGESTRPGSQPVSQDEELSRVIPVIRSLVREADVLISIDTQKSAVAEAALQSGAHIVNDVSAGTHDSDMLRVVSEQGAVYIMMHMQGTPKTMQESPSYEQVLQDINQYFNKRLHATDIQGINRDNIILDPGVGFGKTLDDNLDLISHMNSFSTHGCPVMLGASRKSFIGLIDDSPVDRRLGGSLAAVLAGYMGKVDIFRVHDVHETRQALNIFTAIQNHLD